WVMGSFDYIAPEQANNSRAVDHRADLYGLGCTLFHMLTGQVPFPAPEYETPLQKLRAHADTPPPPLRALRPDAPDRLARVVSRLLAKDPAGRFQTAAELAEALAPFAAGADPGRLLGETSTPRVTAPRKRRTSLLRSPVFRLAAGLVVAV